MSLHIADETEIKDEKCELEGMALPPEGEEPLGSLIGRYKLCEKIGEGGWGIVYVAEQQEPVRRRVALKVIKPGMDTRNVVARFEAERQALARMDHPNIAKVFDGGSTASGRPFFVMELVRGVRITDYCDQHQLSTRERLELFVEVCRAIQHAHQKGVIHRDIKPSNIMVMVADDQPTPKVIDFGIAKAVGERLSDKTTYTRFQQFVGTPAYTSPEQAGLSGLDVDTRSDIYSLGVLLCELLTGRTPFVQTVPSQLGIDDLLHRIREEEAPRPSTLMNRLGLKEQTTTARQRGTEPPKLARVLKGDLDWVVMKCLEKNRTCRYASANDLARDIECYLNQQPVSAVAPTFGYQAVKWLRRHRRAVATAGAFGLVVMLGASITAWQARRAGQAERGQAALRTVHWALETLPEIERALQRDDYDAAFKRVEQVRPFIPDNPRFQALAAQAVCEVSISTLPAGAKVYLRDYAEESAAWEPLGKSPILRVRMPRGFKRWRATLQGYATAEGTFLAGYGPGAVSVPLHPTVPATADMVQVRGQTHKPDLMALATASTPELKIPDFLLDRHEVTNRRFKHFVDAGGYNDPRYWKHKFLKDGVELSWQEAMALLVDQTGKPGPATWEHGVCPPGQEEHPVSGVSWYEAAAYAEYAGRRLPSLYHWSIAAGDSTHVDVGFLIPLSNFGSAGTVPVGSLQGMTSHGVYDMAGNVKEWCFNEAAGHHRVIAGGGWNEPEYMFRLAEKYPPFFRGPNFGFRCMQPIGDDRSWDRAAQPVTFRVPPTLGDRKPCSEEVFQAYRRLYDYPKSDLQPRLEFSRNTSNSTRVEKVSFTTSYGNARMGAYIYLPRNTEPPFQTVVYFPGSGAWAVHSISAYGSAETYESHTRKGRAFVFPVLHGTFERRFTPVEREKTTPAEKRMMWVKDFRRTLDYLELHPEQFDLERLAFEGLSRGAVWGGIIPAIDPRIKAVVLFGGGLSPGFPEEYNQVNFTPRIKVPVLIQNGKYDLLFPLESSQKSYFKLFGTPDSSKALITYDTGHAVWIKNEVRADECVFLDEHFGPIRQIHR